MSVRSQSALLAKGMTGIFSLSGSWQTPIVRRLCNLVPAFRATGARVTYLSGDGHELHIALPKRLRNLNVHGAIYGGSIYSAVAGLPGAMLMRLLGPRYFVALTASSVRFLRPSKTTITGAVRIPPEEIEEIRRALEQDHAVERVFAVELIDTQGQLCCMVENTMHIARRRHEA
ncbi:MAG: YiiD C-terminal domain-containing protein [Syntrophaceae bacterium]